MHEFCGFLSILVNYVYGYFTLKLHFWDDKHFNILKCLPLRLNLTETTLQILQSGTNQRNSYFSKVICST